MAEKSLYPMARIWTSDECSYSDRYLLAYWLQHKTFSGAAVHIWPIHLYPPCEDEGDTEWDWHVYKKVGEWIYPDAESDDSDDDYRCCLDHYR